MRDFKMTRFEWIKSELESLTDGTLVDVWNDFQDSRGYERINLMSKFDEIERIDPHESALDLIYRIKRDFDDFDPNDDYYRIDGYGHYISYSDPLDEVDINDLAEAIDNEDFNPSEIDLDDFESDESEENEN